jgi:hypothetical protein
MKHLLFNKVAFVLAAFALFLVGILHDPDLAKGDAPDPGPVAHEYVPGYQFAPDAAASQPLTQVEIAALNSPTDGAVPTF